MPTYTKKRPTCRAGTARNAHLPGIRGDFAGRTLQNKAFQAKIGHFQGILLVKHCKTRHFRPIKITREGKITFKDSPGPLERANTCKIGGLKKRFRGARKIALRSLRAGVVQNTKTPQAWKYEKNTKKLQNRPFPAWPQILGPSRKWVILQFFCIFFVFPGLRGFCILYHPGEISKIAEKWTQ